MKLESLRYTELEGSPREWLLDESTFGDINLIVGKNASGKSRLLSVIFGLARMLRGDLKEVYADGQYHVRWSSSSSFYLYEVFIKETKVQRERLSRDNTILLDRGEHGIGTIRMEREGKSVDFEAPQSQLAAQVRRDSIQHSFLEDLFTWANRLQFYPFGTPLGRDFLLGMQDQVQPKDQPTPKESPEIRDSNLITGTYRRAFEQFGEPFDQAVLRDLRALGYDCTDVGLQVGHVQVPGSPAPQIATLYVKEVDLKGPTDQINMSQGMFRALALVIHLNYAIFRKIPRTVLIDDVGEGLDFSRSQQFISLLISRSVENQLQLIMTTNDRFVMNGVPLKYWGVLARKAQRVSITNIRSAPKIFADFENLGLNNFDFFSTNFFEEGLVEK